MFWLAWTRGRDPGRDSASVQYEPGRHTSHPASAARLLENAVRRAPHHGHHRRPLGEGVSLNRAKGRQQFAGPSGLQKLRLSYAQDNGRLEASEASRASCAHRNFRSHKPFAHAVGCLWRNCKMLREIPSWPNPSRACRRRPRQTRIARGFPRQEMMPGLRSHCWNCRIISICTWREFARPSSVRWWRAAITQRRPDQTQLLYAAKGILAGFVMAVAGALLARADGNGSVAFDTDRRSYRRVYSGIGQAAVSKDDCRSPHAREGSGLQRFPRARGERSD